MRVAWASDLLLVLSSGIYLVGLIAAWRHVRPDRRAQYRATWPGLTLIKPLAGLDEQLETNLASLLAQSYGGQLEIVFSSAIASDPAISVARRVASRFPAVPARFVVATELGLNPGVSNLAAALNVASHDLVFHSDGNTRLVPQSVSYLVSEFLDSRGSILSCPVIGEGERSLWAAVENAQLTSFVTPAMCFASGPCHQPCVVGKAMLFRKSELDELGGLAAVKDVLAHDYFLGRLYADAGRRVVLSRMPVVNINVERSASQFFERHVRWLQMRLLARPVGWVLDVLANPPLFASTALIASGFRPSQLAILLVVWPAKTALDSRTAHRLRGVPLRPVWAFPLRDAAMPVAAVASLGKRRVNWRGNRRYVGRRTVLRPQAPQPSALPQTSPDDAKPSSIV